MPIVTQCTAPGCETLTMGPLCIEHDWQQARVFARGRPLTGSFAERSHTLAAAVPTRPNLVRRASERAGAVPVLR